MVDVKNSQEILQRPSPAALRTVVTRGDLGLAVWRRLALWAAGVIAAAVPVAPDLFSSVRGGHFNSGAFLGFFASVLFITALGFFEFSVIRHPAMTDPFSIKWTKRLGVAITVFAIIACINAWFFPDGLPKEAASKAVIRLVLHSWAGYLAVALIGEVWLAYELLSWEAKERPPASVP